MTRLAVYAGSFDPPTLGHLDLIQRACGLADRVLVSVGVHPTRKPLFSAEERLELLRQLTSSLPAVEVHTYQGLLVDHCRAVGATMIVRGLRSGVDFEYELPIAQANAVMAPGVETVLLATRPEHSFVSASLAREIAGHGGDIARFVDPLVAEALRRKFVKPAVGA
jgi:pantetheine-phosphate adenylyltransferase